MNRKHISGKPLFVLAIAAMVLMACGGADVEATAAPTTTATAKVESTRTPRPTSTRSPTRTKVPPTPTPAAVGEPVSNKSYEVTVVKVRKLESVYLSETQYWAANPGYQFVELGVRVKNLQPETEVRVPWKNIFVVEQEGTYYPGWAAFKAVDRGVEINPSGLVFHPIDNSGEEVVFNNDAYLRLIFTVKLYDKTNILFGFADSPLTQVVVK